MNNPKQAAEEAPLIVDGEHRVQFELLHAVQAAVEGRPGLVDLEDLIEQYISYSELHFMSEQLLMRLYGYPEFDDHVRDHDILTERLKQMREAQARGDGELLARVIVEQKEHLVGHIGGRDRAFDRFLREVRAG